MPCVSPDARNYVGFNASEVKRICSNPSSEGVLVSSWYERGREGEVGQGYPPCRLESRCMRVETQVGDALVGISTAPAKLGQAQEVTTRGLHAGTAKERYGTRLRANTPMGPKIDRRYKRLTAEDLVPKVRKKPGPKPKVRRTSIVGYSTSAAGSATPEAADPDQRRKRKPTVTITSYHSQAKRPILQPDHGYNTK
jgi:hypothetical protein